MSEDQLGELLNFELWEECAGEAAKNLGQWNFHSRPMPGDLVDANIGRGFKRYRVLGFLHNVVPTKHAIAAPNSAGPHRRKPVVLVKFISFQPDPVL